MEIEDFEELVFLGALAGGLFFLSHRSTKKLDKAELLNDAFTYPKQYTNTTADILKSYDKDIKSLLSSHFKKLDAYDHNNTTTYEVMIQDRLMTPKPLFVMYSFPTIAIVAFLHPRQLRKSRRCCSQNKIQR